jgi:hypothetical protein
MVDKAIVIESKLKEMENDGKRKMTFTGLSFGSKVRPRFSQPNQFFKPLQMNRMQTPMQMERPNFKCNDHNTRCRDQMLPCSEHRSN